MKQIIIIGGGNSIRSELNNGLWDKLKGKYTIGLNYSYKFFKSTVQMYVDHLFYTKELEELKKLPLIIGKEHQQLKKVILPNTIMLKTISKYNKDIKNGVYKSSLCGIFALTLATYFIKEGEIYLLGYDFSSKGKDKRNRALTHWYQSTEEGALQHRGIGKIGYYKSHRRGHNDFGCYRELQGIKIYTVGLESNLDEFEKIDYKMFYSKLNKEKLDQDKIREDCKKQLKGDGLCTL